MMASTTSCERPILCIDLETYSEIDIKTCGSFRYVEDPSFEILLLAYAWGLDGEVRVLDICSQNQFIQENGPVLTAEFMERCEVIRALTDPKVIKLAHNCTFERDCLRKHTGTYMPPEQWHDTKIMAAMNGLPPSLEGAGAALNLEQQKLKEGAALIRYFCNPCRATIANGGRTRNLPQHNPEKWARFKEYCKRDVVTMQAIYKCLRSFRQPEWERRVFELDCRINERGVLIDRDLAEAAVAVDDASRTELLAEMRKITGLQNPNSGKQLQAWLNAQGLQLDSLKKQTVAEALETISDRTLRRVLELRQLLSKTSVKKYQAMLASASPNDDRIRGMMAYYGAGRTGRWAGRLAQPQNLPQNHLDNIAEVRELVRSRDLDSIEMCFDSPADTLAQLIRTALIAKPGHTFLVADYSAIEARVIAYLAGEQWRLDTFAAGGDIYCSSASQMFKVPVEKHGINGHLRQKGKIAELACGYGGGIKALKQFGADKMGLSDEEMDTIVKQWRAASPTIPRMWREVEQAAVSAVRTPGKTFRIRCGVEYWRDKDALRCRLPSGRVLSYWKAWLDDDGQLCFMALNQDSHQWQEASSWGGRLVENIVQAYARDCLAVAMLRLDAAGFAICFSVHDELIAEEPKGGRSWKDMADIMGKPIPWAPGLLLRADGYETDFYMKD